MPIIISPCYGCKNYIQCNGKKEVCRAFPDGIPDDVYWGKVSHDMPIDGDHGIQYVPIEK